MDTFSKEAMNTEMEIRICGADFNYARSAAEDCFSEVFMLEDLLSMYRLGSDVSMVNTCPKGEVCMGTFEGSEVTVGTGRFGPYVRHEGKYVSIPKGTDPLSITLQDAIVLIAKKRKQEEEKHLKKFDDDLEILNGHWGPYIAYKGKNYRIPKNQRETATDLTLEQCMEIVNNAPEPKAKVRKKRS